MYGAIKDGGLPGNWCKMGVSLLIYGEVGEQNSNKGKLV